MYFSNIFWSRKLETSTHFLYLLDKSPDQNFRIVFVIPKKLHSWTSVPKSSRKYSFCPITLSNWAKTSEITQKSRWNAWTPRQLSEKPVGRLEPRFCGIELRLSWIFARFLFLRKVHLGLGILAPIATKNRARVCSRTISSKLKKHVPKSEICAR